MELKYVWMSLLMIFVCMQGVSYKVNYANENVVLESSVEEALKEQRFDIKEITTTTDIRPTVLKDTPITSASGKTAVLTPVEGTHFESIDVTLEDGSVQTCELTNVLFGSLLDFRWLGEEKIILEGHRNPSLNVYVVYDLGSNTFQEYYGLFFTWDSEYETLYYAEKAPHWGENADVAERILDHTGKEYYKTAGGERLVGSIVLDGTDNYLGFFTEAEERDFRVLNCDTKEIMYEEEDVAYDTVEIRYE
ncbi:MAG: hypothetical protein IJY09_06455 [Lachnospiraceae bacterium]|nr:hypothetical protein [Lachnospiraceae bacterium]